MKNKASPEKVPASLNDAISFVKRWLDYKYFFNQTPGFSFGLTYKGKLIATHHNGYSDVSSKKVPNNHTIYRIASISKLFTAIAIMQLAETKKLNLDDSISTFFPIKVSAKKKLEDVTIRHILGHYGGLSRETDEDHWGNQKFPKYEKLLSHLSKNPATYSPLEHFKYSNFAFSLLGKVIEKAAGMSYATYIQKNILDTLKMHETYVDYSPSLKSQMATGYGRFIPNQKRKVYSHSITKAYAPATGFASTVNDLALFLSALRAGNGLLLKDISKKEMRRVHWIKDAENYWGLGFHLSKLKEGFLVGHSGGYPGFVTNIGFHPDNDIGIILLTNGLGGGAYLNSIPVMNMIIHLMNNFSSYNDTSKPLSKYEGRFGNDWGEIEFCRINKQLVAYDSGAMSPFVDMYKLKYLSPGTFQIMCGDGFDVIGENVKFIEKNGSISRIKFGPFDMFPADYVSW